MGKRLGRKRLYALEKEGQSFSGSVGTGISGSVISRTAHREGQNIVTDIVLDLGSSQGALNCPDIKRKVLGYSASVGGALTQPAHLGLVEHMESGVVTLVEATCLEVPTGGPAKIELQYNSSATVTYSGSAGTRLMELPVAAIGSSSQVALDADDLQNKYLYLASAEESDAGAAKRTYTAGKIHIRLHGTFIPADK